MKFWPWGKKKEDKEEELVISIKREIVGFLKSREKTGFAYYDIKGQADLLFPELKDTKYFIYYEKYIQVISNDSTDDNTKTEQIKALMKDILRST